MATKTVNSDMIARFEKLLLGWMPAHQWEEALTEITEDYSYYLLNDENYTGNSHEAQQITRLRVLRDFFKELKTL
jgi:hypothetical protein